ncbi:hypothetical protein MMC07_005693 [Pseudocyphellaria aurata]|nr:hypothetical protein [Pseudocyphellaria aurata]
MQVHVRLARVSCRLPSPHANISSMQSFLTSSYTQAYTQLGDLDMTKRHYGEALRHEPDHAAAKAAFSAAKKLASLKSKD